MMASFVVTAADRDELRELFVTLTEESERLMSGTPYEELDPAHPALYIGTWATHLPADLSIVLSVGESLFDDRYDLADRKPVELEHMPFLANDRLDRSAATVTCSSPSAAPTRTPISLPSGQLMRVTRQPRAVLDARRLHPAAKPAPVRPGYATSWGSSTGRRTSARRTTAPWTASSGWPTRTTSRPGPWAARTTRSGSSGCWSSSGIAPG
jgi:hypothetical protein